MIRLPLILLFSTFLFSCGVYGVLARRNAVMVLMAIELMLNAVNLNLVGFSAYLQDVTGQIFALFVIAEPMKETIYSGVFRVPERSKCKVSAAFWIPPAKREHLADAPFFLNVCSLLNRDFSLHAQREVWSAVKRILAGFDVRKRNGDGLSWIGLQCARELTHFFRSHVGIELRF